MFCTYMTFYFNHILPLELQNIYKTFHSLSITVTLYPGVIYCYIYEANGKEYQKPTPYGVFNQQKF
jgi:hypothetical protein